MTRTIFSQKFRKKINDFLKTLIHYLKISVYLRKRYNLIIQLYRTEQALDDKIIAENEGIDKLKEKIFFIENKLNNKENLIIKMKGELEKYFNVSNTGHREIYIADPDKNNLEIYNELCISKELYNKVSKLLSNEKANNAKLNSTIKVKYIY